MRVSVSIRGVVTVQWYGVLPGGTAHTHTETHKVSRALYFLMASPHEPKQRHESRLCVSVPFASSHAIHAAGVGFFPITKHFDSCVWCVSIIRSPPRGPSGAEKGSVRSERLVTLVSPAAPASQICRGAVMQPDSEAGRLANPRQPLFTVSSTCHVQP